MILFAIYVHVYKFCTEHIIIPILFLFSIFVIMKVFKTKSLNHISLDALD